MVCDDIYAEHVVQRGPSFVNLAEEAKLNLASHATAAAGERGVCAPRAAASAGSHEPLLRGSPQESGSAIRCSVRRRSRVSVLAKSLSDSAFGPGRRAVAATAGVLQRRPVRAHAQRRRLRTTRAAARPSEEQGDEQGHADSAIRESFFLG